MSYPKYPWIGNRIAEADMASLYRLKQQTKKPITILVAEAISRYLEQSNQAYPRIARKIRRIRNDSL